MNADVEPVLRRCTLVQGPCIRNAYSPLTYHGVIYISAVLLLHILRCLMKFESVHTLLRLAQREMMPAP